MISSLWVNFLKLIIRQTIILVNYWYVKSKLHLIKKEKSMKSEIPLKERTIYKR